MLSGLICCSHVLGGCCLSETVPICPGYNKYSSLQLCIDASLGAQVAEDKLSAAPSPPPPYDEAPNKHILRQTICIELLLALQICNTVFTCEVLEL